MAATNIEYFHGDLFQGAGPGSVLAHSCNCMGAWGGGIAVEFKRRFPSAYQTYRQHCRTAPGGPESLLGTCLLIEDKGYRIACLFTSVGTSSGLRSSARARSEPSVIVDATAKALADLFQQLEQEQDIPVVSMPQINAGLFAVPWEETEAVLKTFPHKFNVYIFP